LGQSKTSHTLPVTMTLPNMACWLVCATTLTCLLGSDLTMEEEWSDGDGYGSGYDGGDGDGKGWGDGDDDGDGDGKGKGDGGGEVMQRHWAGYGMADGECEET
jgi:hypothetical protein